METVQENLMPPGRFDDHAFLNYDQSNDFTLYEIGNYSCPPLYSYGPVARTRDIFHFVISGRGKVVIRDKEFNVDKEQGFLIPAGEKAYYIADRDDPWTYCWLHLGGARLEEMWEKAGISVENPVFISEAPDSPVKDLYFQMSNNRNRELFCFAKLYEIMNFIVSTSTNRKKYSPNIQLAYVRKTIQIIQLKYSEPLQVSFIADECGLNRSYLSRLFKDATGRSIQTYLMDYRMKNAIRLLKETNDSIQNIAFLVGYSDIFTFSRAFKKVFGMTPSECRAAEGKTHEKE